MSSGRCAAWIALGISPAVLLAQSLALDLRPYPDCPVALTGYSPNVFRAAGTRRQFVTAKNVSDRVIGALVFQQTVRSGSRVEIMALERVSVIFRPRETKRLSISIDDAWSRAQNAARSPTPAEKPVLSVVVVEFIEGPPWSAPLEATVH